MKSVARLASVSPAKKAWSKPSLSAIEPTRELVELILRGNNVSVEPDDTLESLLVRAKATKRATL